MPKLHIFNGIYTHFRFRGKDNFMAILNDYELGHFPFSQRLPIFIVSFHPTHIFQNQSCLSGSTVNIYKNVSKSFRIFYSFNSHNIPESSNEPFYMGFVNLRDLPKVIELLSDQANPGFFIPNSALFLILPTTPTTSVGCTACYTVTVNF